MRWHPRAEFRALSNEQKDELTAWQRSAEGKKSLKKQRPDGDTGRKGSKRKAGDDDLGTTDRSWKKKFRKALKTQSGLAHVMSELADAESATAPLVAALQPTLPPAPSNPPTAPPRAAQPSSSSVGALAAAFPALSTSVKLNSILKNDKKQD